jgi:hypothetical protein
MISPPYQYRKYFSATCGSGGSIYILVGCLPRAIAEKYIITIAVSSLFKKDLYCICNLLERAQKEKSRIQSRKSADQNRSQQSISTKKVTDHALLF